MKKKFCKTYDKLKNRLRLIFSFGKRKKKIDLKENIVHFLREEEKEIEELVSGKEDFPRYCRDSAKVFKDYFIPGDHNEHHPKILRPKPIIAIAVLMVALKVFLVAYIFVVYQEEARMSDDILNRILVLTNEARAKTGAQELKLNNVLSRAAVFKAEDMLAKDYFAHTTLDGLKPWDLVDRALYPYALIGENLAMNFIAADDAHSALMTSPLHEKNILNPRFGEIGLAVINGEMSGKNTNVLVQIFGALTVAAASVTETVPLVEPIVEASQTEETEVKPLPDPIVAGNSSEPDIIDPVNTEEAEPKAIDIQKEDNAVVEPEKIAQAPEEIVAEMPVIDNNNSTGTESVVEGALEEVLPEDFNKDNLPEEQNGGVEEEIFIEEELPLFEDQAENSEILATDPVYVNLESNSRISRAAKIILIVKVIYVVFLVFLIIALLINIFIRVAYQHKPAITRTILLIFLILILLLFDFGFMSEIKQAAGNLIVL